MSNTQRVSSCLRKVSWEQNLSINHMTWLLSKASAILQKNGIDWNEKTKRAVICFFKPKITEVKVYKKTVDEILVMIKEEEEWAKEKLKKEIQVLGGEEYYELIISS